MPRKLSWDEVSSILVCVAEDDGSYDEIAIRITVRDLLEVAAPLVVPG